MKMTSIIRLAGKFILILFLLLLLFAYAMFQGGFVSWFLFFSCLPILLYSISLLFCPMNKLLQISRKLSHHVIHAGDGVTVTWNIKRTIPFPLYYCVCEEIFPDSLKKFDSRSGKYKFMDKPEKMYVNRTIKKIVFPGFHREIDLAYRIEQVPRGEHQLQAVRIKTGDLFGFVTKEHIYQADDQLVAYPNERQIKMTERISSFEHGSAASHALNLKNTNVATGIREYLPGDKFSWIDWKQTARKHEMMTKEFEQEKSTDTMLILNSCYVNGMNPLAFESAIEITVSIMEAIRRQSSRVGFLSIGEETTHFPLDHDQTKKDRMMKYLTSVQATGKQPFSIKLKEESLKMSGGSIVFIMTTNLDNSFRQTISQLRSKSKRVIVVYVQAASLISKQEHQIIQQLKLSGVVVNVLTERQLRMQTVEVNVV